MSGEPSRVYVKKIPTDELLIANRELPILKKAKTALVQRIGRDK